MLVPSAAIASHNSAGGHVAVVSPDEVSADGKLQPDVTGDALPVFHTNLDQPRPAPVDQSGQRYTDCDTYAETKGGDSNGGGGYDPASDPTDCYVGYLDGQWEYMSPTQIFGIERSQDLLYPANPDDDYCSGKDETGERSLAGEDVPTVLGHDSAPDEVIAGAARSDDARCSGSGHSQFLPGFLMVDSDLLETPSRTAAQAAGTDTASGTNTLPLLIAPYVFLFGQPHDSNDNASEFRAGEGPFGTPPADLTGACGDRTKECRLLNPADVRRYDTNDANLQTFGQGVPGLADLPRVCHYTPTLTYEHPKPDRRAASPCGPQGRVVDDFFGNRTHGGFGVTGAPTWVSPTPGWYRGVVMTTLGTPGRAVDLADEHAADPTPSGAERFAAHLVRDFRFPPTDDRDGNLTADIPQVFAVNPRVPLPTDALWCLAPNIYTDGTQGVYGTYQADAIDTDLYRGLSPGIYQDLVDVTHPTARPVAALAEAALPSAEDGADETPLPDGLAENFTQAADRANPTTDDGPDTPSATHDHAFTRDVPAGLGCTPDARIVERADQTSLDGTLRMDARLQANTGNDDQIQHFPRPIGAHLKDPTEGGEVLPPSSETEPESWSPELHSFRGKLQAVVDANQNGRYDPCRLTGAGDPIDVCPWEGLWDAYNPACTDPDGTTCEAILDQRGFDTDAGVGLYFVLELTGPILVLDEDRRSGDDARSRTHLVGTETPSQRNCVVGTSVGLTDKLIAQDPAVDDRATLLEKLCEGTGDRILIEDAFDDQTTDENQLSNADDPGVFSAAVQWTRLVPGPDASSSVQPADGSDRLCVSAVLNVQPGTVAEGTVGNLELGGGEHVFTDCDAYGPA